MFIAHFASGYIMAVLAIEHFPSLKNTYPSAIWAGTIGAVAPDFDMLYFYLIDHRQTHHHKYVTHWPILWTCLLAASLVWVHYSKRSRVSGLSLLFTAGGFLHLLLDSFVGDIWWFAPAEGRPFSMFTVPALFEPWWLNFLFHWSFAVELGICIWALALYRQRSIPVSTQRAHSRDRG